MIRSAPRGVAAVAAVALLCGGCAAGKAGTPPAAERASWDFEGDRPGSIPVGWRVDETNPTTALAAWRVTGDDMAPSGAQVLALVSSANYDGTYNLAIAEGSSFEDLDLTVRAKAVAGVEDQGGGPIWRCRDANNYYICRFNPLEGNFRVYVVRDGRRRQLDSATMTLAAGRWYEIGIRMVGSRITCSLDGVEMLHATNDTFPGPGMVGLWTKADAVTSFDDLAVRPARDGA
jgi:hypothetical protein